jgi:ankyrin repeat protein
MLLSYGAEMDPLAIFYAIGGIRNQDNGTATLEMLIDHDADINYVSDRWCTPLCYAIRRSKNVKLKLLLNHGANPDIKPLNFGVSALEYAKEQGRMDLYELMEVTRRWSAPRHDSSRVTTLRLYSLTKRVRLQYSIPILPHP